jgi:peptide/nickel transport system permease protein
MKKLAARVAHVVAVLLLVTFAVTFMADLTPGDPAYAILGDQATPAQVAQVHAQLHLDDPFYERYWTWLSNVVTGDFGTSLRTQQSVLDAIGERLPVTLEIVVLALVIALLAAIPIGIATAVRAGGAGDRVWSLASSALIALPVFVTGLLFVYVFSVGLRGSAFQLPATGWAPVSDGLGENLRHVLLPALTLALVELPVFARLLRADMITTLGEDYILAASAKGLPMRRILLRHALRPSSFSLVTVSGLSLGRLIGGAVVVEMLFSLPGIGQQLVLAVEAKDIVVVQGVVAFIAIGYVLVNAGVNALYRVLDPRVAHG